MAAVGVTTDTLTHRPDFLGRNIFWYTATRNLHHNYIIFYKKSELMLMRRATASV